MAGAPPWNTVSISLMLRRRSRPSTQDSPARSIVCRISGQVRSLLIWSTNPGTLRASTAKLRFTISLVEAVPCPASGAKATTGRGVRSASRTVTPAPLVTTTFAAAISSGIVVT